MLQKHAKKVSGHKKDGRVRKLGYYVMRNFLAYILPSIDRIMKYRGADKSLSRPGRKQARKHNRDARDFNNIETRAVIEVFSPTRQGAEGNSRHSDRNISLFPLLVGLRTYQHPCIGCYREWADYAVTQFVEAMRYEPKGRELNFHRVAGIFH